MTHRAVRRQQGLSLWPLLVLIVILAALGAAGWWGWQQWQLLEKDRQGLGQRVETLRGELERRDQERRQAEDQLRQQQQQLEARMARDREALADVRQGGQTLWLINEAEALASLAGQRLMLTGDAAAARRLLKAADDTLARLDDPDALPARQALANDMEKLNGALQVDIQAMVLRLGALQSLVPDLALPERQAPPRQSPEPGQGSWWSRLLDQMPVTVSRHDGEVPVPLTETQAATVRLTLDASLQQARLALMQGRAQAYQQALDSANATLDQWFRDDQGRVKQMRAALEELGGQQVNQALPEIGAGLDAIRQLKRDVLKRDGGEGGR
ncbi:uroporphyrinogen-III C-methyltransferase [Alloalcanivorax gelatiniphagus]|uniref:Heme biosynthesis operon protein HemX n=3 Tax=Alloalcanivorax gelatiniphagus TaxID=1194167 RepID=A0ABY2XJA5_9GAMM|nr:uroporphyrinogen-III C-methyltransferase [Alloalcanivorax gelatiniphagus]TMW11619.1 hypothetical protein FGS76_13645 [Alloalcanivorax gelatiniphagus]